MSLKIPKMQADLGWKSKIHLPVRTNWIKMILTERCFPLTESTIMRTKISEQVISINRVSKIWKISTIFLSIEVNQISLMMMRRTVSLMKKICLQISPKFNDKMMIAIKMRTVALMKEKRLKISWTQLCTLFITIV